MENIKKKILLIVNPCAGRTKSRAGTFDIVDKFSKNDYEFTIRTTTCQGDATNIVRREADKHDMVVCCGGDGTLNETVNGVMDLARRLPVGYIPSGSTNDLAATLGIPTDIKQATDLIISENMNDYDLGLFNNRYFSYVASFGAFTRSCYTTSQKMKNIFGHAAYYPAAIPDAFNIKKYRLRVEHDEGIIEDDFVFGSISNSTSVAGFFKFNVEDVKLNDGYFELLLCRSLKFRNVIPTLYKVRHQNYDGKQLIFLRTKKLKVTSLDGKEIEWTLDGEYGGAHKEVMVHVLERAVHICSSDNPLFIKHEKPVFEPPISDENEAKERKLFKKRKAQKSEDTSDEAAVDENAEITANETDVTEEKDETTV